MAKKILLISIMAFLVVLTMGQKQQQDKKEISAYIVKIVKDVNFKSPATGWEKAVPLSKLKSGYEVKTEKGSLAMIIFADQSKLILREKSIAMIKGEVRGKEILSRSVHMDRGDMLFTVKKAESEQFRFSSPISVASIRGTQGGYVSGGNADSLTIAEGLADFTNIRSGMSGSVGTGQTGVADSSGGFNIHRAGRRTLKMINESQNFSNDLGGADTSGLGGSVADFSKLKSKHSGSVKVDLSSFQGQAIAASIFTRKQNEQSFVEIPLIITGQVAEGKIPADRIKYPKLEYYLSISLSKGSTSIIPQDGMAKPAVVSVEAFKHELRIPGQTGSLQKKVVVIKWDD
jgi:hypothetical protein